MPSATCLVTPAGRPLRETEVQRADRVCRRPRLCLPRRTYCLRAVRQSPSALLSSPSHLGDPEVSPVSEGSLGSDFSVSPHTTANNQDIFLRKERTHSRLSEGLSTLTPSLAADSSTAPVEDPGSVPIPGH